MDEIIEYVRGMPAIKTHTISLVQGETGGERYGDVDAEKYIAAVRKLEQNLKTGMSPVYRFRGRASRPRRTSCSEGSSTRRVRTSKGSYRAMRAGSTWFERSRGGLSLRTALDVLRECAGFRLRYGRSPGRKKPQVNWSIRAENATARTNAI